jgi:imidazole glycerol-phosphate synthase subunit HisH
VVARPTGRKIPAVTARIAIADYGMGNLRSVEKALEHVGCEATITAEPADIDAAGGVVLPGVGAFPKAMERIRALGLDELIADRAASGVPILGVCLGMQLLFDSSTEHCGAEGLGLLPGTVERLVADELKLPHIGWSTLRCERPSPLSEGIADGEPFYFVHSLAPRAASEHVLGTAEYGERFAAVVGRERIFGTQFHPEKSSRAGLRMLRNFAAICAPVAAGA